MFLLGASAHDVHVANRHRHPMLPYLRQRITAAQRGERLVACVEAGGGGRLLFVRLDHAAGDLIAVVADRAESELLSRLSSRPITFVGA